MLSRPIISLVAERLGATRLPSSDARDIERLALPEGDADALSNALIDAGVRVGVSFVRRRVSRTEASSLVVAHPGPSVVVPIQAGPTAALVLWPVAGERCEGERFSPGADTGEPQDGTPAELLRAMGDAFELLLAVRLIDPAHDAPDIGPFGRLFEIAGAERGHIVLVYLYAFLVGLFSLTLPLGVQAIIGLVSGGLILQPVILLVTFVVLGTLAYGVLQVMQLSVVETIQQRIFARFALEFAARIPRFALDKRAGEDLTERMNRFFEVLTIQKSGAKLLTDGSTAALQVLFGLVLLTAYHPYFAFFGLGLLAMLALLFRITGPKGLATSIKESTFKYRAVQWLEELARASTSLKFGGQSTIAVQRMDEHVSGYLKYRRAHFDVLAQQKIAMVVFKTAITGGLLVLGSVLVIDRQISLGQFVASEIVVVTVIAGIEKLIASLADVYDLLTSVEKLAQIRELPLEEGGGLAPRPSSRGLAVSLRDVSFSYPGAPTPTLRGITFRVGASERVGIVGEFGSGESTLVRVLASIYRDYDGSLLFDDVTARDLDPTALRAMIGQVLPGEPLFDGSVEENVTLGRAHLGPEAVREALERVGAYEFVQEMPQGLRTPVVAGGRALPATIVLRLLLARAIVDRPRLLILDEVFSTFDAGERRLLTTMLTARDVPWTLIAVSHDAEFLAACDRVVVLRDGAVRATGTWAEVAADAQLREVAL
jgi:ABC-type bacteriocin/lantibiotic exporter with double-glycine peptidase domain